MRRKFGVQMLETSNRALLDNVAAGVFDGPIDPHWSAVFLASPNHHLAVAVDARLVVGMSSAIHYVHPDKGPELWVNEVGVAPSHRCRGVGKALLSALFKHGLSLGCREAWVLTEADNAAARGLYASVGGDEAAEQSVCFNFRLGRAGLRL